MDLAGIVVVALDAEHHRVHHRPQAATPRQLVGSIQVQKMAEIATLNF